jgi:glycosyltransferase involved in cell wall biosynthesis
MLRLVVVGEGGSLEDLRRLAAELGLAETVVFAGLQPPMPSVHNIFEISVLCSRSEGFPNAVVEAMAAGRPVVGTDVIGIRDAVRADETGLLVPPADPAALADALDRLLSDEALRRAMGEAGRRRAAEEYHGDRVIATLESLYEEMVERPTRGHR